MFVIVLNTVRGFLSFGESHSTSVPEHHMRFGESQEANVTRTLHTVEATNSDGSKLLEVVSRIARVTTACLKMMILSSEFRPMVVVFRAAASSDPEHDPAPHRRARRGCVIFV